MTDPRVDPVVDEIMSTLDSGYWATEWATKFADRILAAADNAATITTVEEVWAMPTDSVVRDATDEVYERRRRGWQTIGSMAEYTSDAIRLPARVIHWGTE